MSICVKLTINGTNILFSERGMLMKKSLSLRVSYDGQLYRLDADTLLVSLLHFVEMLKIVSFDVIPQGEIQFRIEAVEKGSFVVILELTEKIASGLLGLIQTHQEYLHSFRDVLEIVVGLITLKKLLSGGKPDRLTEEGNQVTIVKAGKDATVNINILKKYYINYPLNKHMERLFETLSEDQDVEGLTVTMPSDDVGFHVDRKDFGGLAKDNEMLEQDETKDVVKGTLLRIVKVVFQRNRKWDFIYDGNKISAFIEDNDFWNKVDGKELRFSKGDILVVDLEIIKHFDPEINAFVNKKYKVTRFYEYKPGVSTYQTELPFHGE